MASTADNIIDFFLNFAKWHLRRIMKQLPPHDDNPKYCSSLTDCDVEWHVAEQFATWRRRQALGRGTVYRWSSSDVREKFGAFPASCQQCGDGLIDDDLVVNINRMERELLWHADCFVCCICRQQLVELVYFFGDGKIYCGRHHAETLRPRCRACDEIIFADYCTEAEGWFWHCHHWACIECRRSLAGQKYTLLRHTHNDVIDPVCLDCYHSLHADYCASCGRIIGIDDCHVTPIECAYGDNHFGDKNPKWHLECFESDVQPESSSARRNHESFSSSELRVLVKNDVCDLGRASRYQPISRKSESRTTTNH